MALKMVPCLICGCKEYSTIFSYSEPDKYETAAGIKKEDYFRKWVKCKGCGFCYSIYSREKEILNKIYELSYRSSDSSWRKDSPEAVFKKVISLPSEESETKFRVDWIKKNFFDIWKDGLIQHKNPPFELLDIGGGTGVFAYEFMEDSNWIPHVVDPDKNANFLKAKHKIDFVQGYYEPGLFHKKFDLISLIYVLEHLTNPKQILGNLIIDLKENSLVYLEVPDSIAFEHKPKDDEIFNSCHLWMFSPYTIARFLNTCGFQILCLKRLKIKRGHYSLMLLASANILNNKP